MRWWVVGGGGGHCRDCDGALVLAAKMAGGLLRLEIPDAKERAVRCSGKTAARDTAACDR